MDLTGIIKNQDFFKNLINEKQKNTMSSALLFFCDDEVTASKVLVLTALLLEYPTFEMFNEQSAEFVKIEKKPVSGGGTSGGSSGSTPAARASAAAFCAW